MGQPMRALTPYLCVPPTRTDDCARCQRPIFGDNQQRRWAHRAPDGQHSDAELGFYLRHRPPGTPGKPSVTAALVPTMAERRALTIWLAPTADTASMSVCAARAAIDA